MTFTAKNILQQITPSTKLGDLRKLAKDIKVDHELGLNLWAFGGFLPRQLAILILDKKLLDSAQVDKLITDINQHPHEEKLHLIDWLMANQLMKHKKLIGLIESWEIHSSALHRRVFWYYQARLRWMGKTDYDNTEYLLDQIEAKLLKEVPEVQWAMNYTAGQIGKWEDKYRKRCISIGESSGLYKDEIVAKKCTPSYLPEFIRIEVNKLKK